jgi:hypothetical protein
MTTYRVKHNKDNPYTKLDKAFLQSPNLSAKAKGILAYLLSLPSDWRVCLNHLVTVFADGETSIRSGIAELKSAGYLSKAAIRDSTGQIINWVTDVYETPHQIDRPIDRNGNFIIQTYCPQEAYPDVDFPHLANLDVDNRKQLINKTPLRNNLTNPPFPSQTGGEEESFELLDTEINASQDLCQEPFNCNSSVAKEQDLLGDGSSAVAVTNLNEVIEPEVIGLMDAQETKDDKSSRIEEKAPTRHHKLALGNKPPDEPKNVQQRQFRWLADGPWLVEGKLDSSFVTWLATTWQRQYGGTIHQKRANVLRHFKKDPTNLAIAWEQYRGEHLSRYENAAVRMGNGLEIQPIEQQELLHNVRAVTHRLPDELNPVAVQSRERICVLLRENQNQTTLLASATREDVLEDTNYSQFQTQAKENSFPLCPHTGGKQDNINQGWRNSSVCPTDDDGCVLNPTCYQQWQPQTVEDEPACTSAFKERLAAFYQQRALCSHRPRSFGKDRANELDELNAWLLDPILKHEAMARVMRSDGYTIKFDSEGEPLRIIKIKS